MLPILRILPVGGVLLAIAILVLALNPPSAPHVVDVMVPAGPPRGALISREEHPEWPQFLILAALRRATELDKLRDLPDTPTRVAPVLPPKTIEPAQAKLAAPPAKVAGLPQPQDKHDDVTGSVQPPEAAIPVDIGETSSTELPVLPQREQPPVVMMPAHITPPQQAMPAPPQAKPVITPPANAKQASRDVSPAPLKPKPDVPAAAPPAIAPPAIAPAPAKPAAAPTPLPPKLASLAPEPATPNVAARKSAAPRQVVRKKRRRVRRAKVAQQQPEFQFNLFAPFFQDTAALPPGKIRPRREQ